MKRRMRWLVTLTLLAVVVVIWYYMDSNKPSELDNLDSENSTDSEINQQNDKDNQNFY